MMSGETSPPANGSFQRFIRRQADEQRERLTELGNMLETVAGFQHFIGALAAPRVLAKADMSIVVQRVEMLALVDRYLAIIDQRWPGAAVSVDSQFSRTRGPTHRIRSLLAEWDLAREAPPEIVRAAREWMAAFGCVMTDEEWEQYEIP